MDQGNRGLPSLTHTMYLDKALCRHLSPPPIGVPPALVAGITGSAKASITESRLLLDLLAAESALEEFRSAKAEELALRTSMERKREHLLSSLVAPRIAQITMHLPPYVVEPCVIAVRDNALSAAMDKSLSKSPSQEVHSLHPSCRRSNGTAAGHQHSRQPITKVKSIAAPSTVKSHKPASPTRLHEKKSKGWDVSLSFPCKLFHMLEEADAEGHADVVSFQPDGKSFVIHKPYEFEQEVLPKYFRMTRLSSLQKQFSMYGFKKIRNEPDSGSVRHEFFQRDNKRLIGKITRKRQGLPKQRAGATASTCRRLEVSH